MTTNKPNTIRQALGDMMGKIHVTPQADSIEGGWSMLSVIIREVLEKPNLADVAVLMFEARGQLGCGILEGTKALDVQADCLVYRGIRLAPDNGRHIDFDRVSDVAGLLLKAYIRNGFKKGKGFFVPSRIIELPKLVREWREQFAH